MVNYPVANWEDYSYGEVASETYPGKVTYYNTNGLTHSAITTSTTGRYTSKWGPYCLFTHDWDECPYGPSEDATYTGRKYYEREILSGPNLVCTANSTFTLDPTPLSSTVSWSVSPSQRVSTSSGTGSTAVFSGSCSQHGNAAITYTIDGPYGLGYYSKDIICGGPDPMDLDFRALYTDGSPAPTGGSIYLLCPYTHYHIYLDNDVSYSCGVSNLSWTIPAGWTKNYQSSNMISIYTNASPGGQVSVNGQTCCGGCGSNVYLLTGYFGTYYNCGGYYMASPNPAGDYAEIKLASADDITLETRYDSDITLTVVDKMGTPVMKVNVESLPYILDTSKLPNGEYIIQILSQSKDQEPLIDAIKLIVSK